MESYIVSVCGRSEGILFQNRTVVPLKGPILTLTNDAQFPSSCQNIGFAHAAVDKTGTRIAAGDCQGNIYIFSRTRNRFWFVCHLDRCSTYLIFTPCKEADLIVATSDCLVSFINSESCTVNKSHDLHKTCVNHISLDAKGKRALTSSLDIAVMWNVPESTILHKLSLKKNVDILKAFFLPVKDYVVAAFKDGSVFIWDSITLQHITKFVCSTEDASWLRTADGSKDGSLIICAGKKDQVMIWGVESQSFLYSISLAHYTKCVKQATFLASFELDNKPHLVCILSSYGKIHICDIDTAEHFYTLAESDGKISTFTEAGGMLAVITSTNTLKIYDLMLILQEDKKAIIKPPEPPAAKELHDKQKALKKPLPDKKIFTEKDVLYILSAFGRYPDRFRKSIWLELLKLPQNEVSLVYWKAGNVNFPEDFTVPNPTIKRALVKVLSMLIQWCPFLKHVDYLPSLLLPFINVLHQDLRMCFELAMTLITSWCQNWFLYLPFPPFNIMSAVENLLLYHDRTLLHHFLLHEVPSEIYAFTLLRTSFSEVFDESQWLQLWDNIFSNSPDFIIFLVVAYNMMLHEVLLQCKAIEDFKRVFSKHFILVSDVIKNAHHLQSTTPICFDPSPIVGSFVPLQSGSAYSAFTRFTVMEINFEILEKQRILDSDFEYLKDRAKELETDILTPGATDRGRSEVLKMKLLELKRLQGYMREIILQSANRKHIKRLEEMEAKVMEIQKLITENIISHMSAFDMKIEGEEEVVKKAYIKKSDFDKMRETSKQTFRDEMDDITSVMDYLSFRETIMTGK